MASDAAFEVLYREYYARVFGLCRRLLGSADVAEDAVQETFMRAYRNFRKYDASQPFWQWIATIANNHCVDVLRRRAKTTALFGDEAAEMESFADPLAETGFSQVIREENAQALNEAVLALPARYRVPVVLAYFSQLSYDEIAAQLDITRNHVGVLLLRAKEQLREALGGTGAGQS